MRTCFWLGYMGKTLDVDKRVVSATWLLKKMYRRGWKCELLRMSFTIFFQGRNQPARDDVTVIWLSFFKSSGIFIKRFSFLRVKWVDNSKVNSYCEFKLRPSECLVCSEGSEG